jgi:hypothetical protein
MWTVIGLEPACVAAFLHELIIESINMLPKDEWAQRQAKQIYISREFLAGEAVALPEPL